MTPVARIYLDNAATSWPKPDAVYEAVDRYQRECGAPFGRGVHAHAVEAARAVDAARQGIARLLGAGDPRRIVFSLNATDALNLAIHGWLRPGDHVVTTVTEHNSVLRPLRFLEDSGRISVERVACDQAGLVDPNALRQALRKNTTLVALCHASNVTGAIQPLERIAASVRAHGAKLLVDASQSLGHLPLSVAQTPIDLLAAPGHKGLLGPLGTGFLYLGHGLEQRLLPLRQGGTGSRSDDDHQPDLLPDRYEAGNLNVPGLVGLAAGVDWLEKRSLAEVRRHEIDITRRLLDGLKTMSGLQVHGPARAEDRVGVVSVTVEGYDPQEVAVLLDQVAGVQVRAGLHCAPRMHGALGTSRRGGTIRFSPGPFTTVEQIDLALEALRSILVSG